MPGRSEQDAAFLEALRRTGNARLAARDCALNRATLYKRRARDPAFASAWREALQQAQVALASNSLRSSRAASSAVETRPSRDRTRTRGGEPTVIRCANGRLQLRRAPPGRITPAAERAFLAAIGRGASVRLAAATAGFAHTSFYARARADPAFAREMKAALDLGADRLEWAAIEAANHGLGLGWEDAPCAIAPMSVREVLQFLHYRLKAREAGRAGGRWPNPPTIEEVTASIERKVAAINRAREAPSPPRRERDGERGVDASAHPEPVEGSCLDASIPDPAGPTPPLPRIRAL